MSTTYKTLPGDTYQAVARRVYGSGEYADRIRQANPGEIEPLQPGTELSIPAVRPLPESADIDAAQDEVIFTVAGSRLRRFDKIRFVQAIDTISIVEVSGAWEYDLAEYRRIFKPFSYPDMTLFIGGQKVFSGVMVGAPDPSVDPNGRRYTASGYARAGVLNDSTPPASMFSGGVNRLEFKEQNLKSIASTLCAPFGLSPVFRNSAGGTFEQVDCEPTAKVLDFLINLSKQRNFVISNDSDGNPVFQRGAVVGQPVAVFEDGKPPVLNVKPFFSQQQYHSHVTGIEPTVIGSDGTQFTVKNPLLKGVIRPYTFIVPEGQEVETATRSQIARMYGSMVSYAVEVSTWRDSKGQLWQPNTFVKLTSPSAMVFNPYTFLIRSVEYLRDEEKTTARLDLVMPGSFSDKLPERLPWDE